MDVEPEAWLGLLAAVQKISPKLAAAMAVEMMVPIVTAMVARELMRDDDGETR